MDICPTTVSPWAAGEPQPLLTATPQPCCHPCVRAPRTPGKDLREPEWLEGTNVGVGRQGGAEEATWMPQDLASAGLAGLLILP